jgi:hypothetical protein
VDGGTLSPGNSAGVFVIGNLTLTNLPTLIFELGADSDRVIVTNDLTFAGMETGWFLLSTNIGFGMGDYTLFEATNLFGSFGALTNFTNIGGSGLDGTLRADGNNVVLNVVPEPGAGALVAAGLLTMLLLRRRHE